MTGGTCGVKIGHSKVPPLEGPIVPAKPRKKKLCSTWRPLGQPIYTPSPMRTELQSMSWACLLAAVTHRGGFSGSWTITSLRSH